MPVPLSEQCIMTVKGLDFKDWESVWVQCRWAESFPLFRFTMAERDPPFWAKLQFKPGDMCTISLAGAQAIRGVIESRQVAYEANQHLVELTGVGVSKWAAKSSVDTETGAFENMTFMDIAKKVWEERYGIPVKQIGIVPNWILVPPPQANIGETTWDFLERLARQLGIVLGTDEFGNFQVIGPHKYDSVATLQEGVNILKMQCTITVKETFKKYRVVCSTPGTDQKNMTAASEIHGEADGTAPVESLQITPSENPDATPGECKMRADNEKIWHEGTIIEATVTVQGWTKASGPRPGQGGIWKAGEKVTVNSPMAMLNGQEMKIMTVTYTQDNNSGTLTTLDLVMPELLRDQRLRISLPMWPEGFNLNDIAKAVGTGTQPPIQEQPSASSQAGAEDTPNVGG